VREEIVIFARAPRLGQVKSRLAASLGAEKALSVYISLLRELAVSLRDLPSITIFHAPADAENELKAFFPTHWSYRSQEGMGLGERLLRASEQMLAIGPQKLMIIGSDCPYLTQEDLAEAFARLETHDLVIGPAIDGGYWLIGFKSLHRPLFQEISWSTGEVLRQTLAIAERLQLKTALLRELSDIDSEKDWRDFEQFRKPPPISSI